MVYLERLEHLGFADWCAANENAVPNEAAELRHVVFRFAGGVIYHLFDRTFAADDCSAIEAVKLLD